VILIPNISKIIVIVNNENKDVIIHSFLEISLPFSIHRNKVIIPNGTKNDKIANNPALNIRFHTIISILILLSFN